MIRKQAWTANGVAEDLSKIIQAPLYLARNGIDLVDKGMDLSGEVVAKAAIPGLLLGGLLGRAWETNKAPDNADIKAIQKDTFNSVIAREISILKRNRRLKQQEKEEKNTILAPQRALKII